jgi:hypothetical protein
MPMWSMPICSPSSRAELAGCGNRERRPGAWPKVALPSFVTAAEAAPDHGPGRGRARSRAPGRCARLLVAIWTTRSYSDRDALARPASAVLGLGWRGTMVCGVLRSGSLECYGRESRRSDATRDQHHGRYAHWTHGVHPALYSSWRRHQTPVLCFVIAPAPSFGCPSPLRALPARARRPSLVVDHEISVAPEAARRELQV